jgi:translation initiation factor IF-3
MAEVVYAFGLGGLKEFIRELFYHGLVNKLVDIKKYYPEEYEQFDFKMFKKTVAQWFESELKDLHIRFVVFFDGKKCIKIENGKQFLKIVNKYYKPLEEFYSDIINKVETTKGRYVGSPLLPSASTYLGVTGRFPDSRS